MAAQESSTDASRLSPVISRLKELGEPISRSGQINRLIDRFAQKDPALDFKIKQSVLHFNQFGQEELIGEEAKKELQNFLAAYLFYQNRLLYQQEGGKNYDIAKERRQVEAVVASLAGRHVHMGTGEGKSSVVIPIASIIEAVSSDKKATVVATASQTLLEEIKTKTEKLIEQLKSRAELSELAPATDIPVKQQGKDFIDDPLFHQMQKEALLKDDFSDDTKKSITKSYWQQILAEPSSESDDIWVTQAAGSRIIFVPERELVFRLSENPKDFARQLPKVLMDEADVPFNRNTPYVRTCKDRFVTPEELQNSTFQWLFNYIVGRQIKIDDFEYFQGQYKLKDAVVNTLKLTFDTSNEFLREGVGIVAQKLGFNEQESAILHQKAITNLTQQIKPSEDLKEYALAVGDLLAQAHQAENRGFILNDRGLPVIRDSYIDELLEQHQHQPINQLAILALTSYFDFVPLNQTNYSTLKFPTFVYYLADKLVCFSGTLLYPDPKTGKIKNSSFSKFLTDITARKVELVTPPDKKTIPQPKWFDSDDQMTRSIAEDLEKSTKPLLVIDYEGVEHSQKLFEKLKKESVVYLPSKPSEPQAEKEYNLYLAQIASQLASGQIKMIVSSGAAGVGLNIVSPDGSFPDLKVVLCGMPEHELQLTQGAGRRRAAGDDCDWYINDENIDRFFSQFPEEKADKLNIFLGEVDQLKIKEMITQAKHNPAKRLDVILEILKQNRRKTAENHQMTIEYDLAFPKIIQVFSRLLDKGLEKNYPDKKLRNNLVKRIGVPSNLYQDIFQLHPLVPGADSKNIVNRVIEEITIGQPGEEKPWIDQQISQWIEANQRKLSDFNHLILFDGRVNSEPFNVKLIPQVRLLTKFSPAPELFPSVDGFNPISIVFGKKSFSGLEKDGYLYLAVLGPENDPQLLDASQYESFSFLPLANQFALFAKELPLKNDSFKMKQ